MKKKADDLIQNGCVRVLVDFDVPPEAIAILGKGLGFAPTPCHNQIQTRLDYRRISNKLIQQANRERKENKEDTSSYESDVGTIFEAEEGDEEFVWFPRWYWY